MARRISVEASGPGAVAIGGDVHGDVVTHVYGAAAVPIELARQDPAPMLADVGVGRPGFAPRAWLGGLVDDFLARNDRGYLLIEAEAGIGKTAYAAHLVASRGWISHFTRLPGGTARDAALRNLAAQLAQRYDLVSLFPGGLIAPWAEQPPGFAMLLARASAVARDRGEQLVIVLDGLDEAEADILPGALPTGVFVVATHRTGRAVDVDGSPAEAIVVRADDLRHRADIEGYLSVVLAEPAFAGHGDVDELIDRCGGIWVYLRYVLEEIRLGLRAVDDLDGLPASLALYYARQVARWRELPHWAEIVGLLAVAREPLSAQTLATLCGTDAATTRQLLARPLRPFLALDTGTPRRHTLFHTSLRDFLRGAPPPTAQSDRLTALAEELRANAAAAERRLASHVLAEFGTLSDGLPRLAADPAIGGIHDGYALRHLVAHVSAMDQAEAARLLAVENRSGRNVWFVAHEHAGSIDAFLRDARMAAPPGVEGEVRYALTAAAVRDSTAGLTPDLLNRLLETAVWSPARALAHARRLVDPAARLNSLLTVRPHVAFDRVTHDQVLVQAERAALEITDPRARLRALLLLLPHLPAVAGRALTESVRLFDATAAGPLSDALPDDDLPAAVALVFATRYLPKDDLPAAPFAALLARTSPEETRTELIRHILRIAVDKRLVRPLIPLVPLLDDDGKDLLLRIWPTAGQGPAAPADLLAALVPVLGDARRRRAADQALALPAGPTRFGALLALLPSMLDDRAERVAAELIGGLIDTDTPGFPAEWWFHPLTLLAGRVDEQQRRAMLRGRESADLVQLCGTVFGADPAVTARQLVERSWRVDSGLRWRMATAVLPQLTAPQLAELFETMLEHRYGEEAAGELIGVLAPRLNTEQRAAAEAWATTGRIDPEDGIPVWLGLMSDATGGERDRLLEAALAVARARTFPPRHVRAVARLLPHLTAAHRTELLDDGCRERDRQLRAARLWAIASRLSGPQLRRLLRRITDDSVVPWLAPPDQAAGALREIEEVLEWERALPSLSAQDKLVERIGTMAGYFDEAGLSRAAELALHVYGVDDMATAVMPLAPYLTPDRCREVAEQAITTALRHHPAAAAAILAAYAPRLDPEIRAGLLADVTAQAFAAEKPAERAVSLARCVALLDDGERRAAAVAEVVDALLTDQRGSGPVLGEKTFVVGLIGAELAPAQLDRLATAALAITRTDHSAAAIAAVTRFAGPELLARLMAAHPASAGERGRIAVLGALAAEAAGAVAQATLTALLGLIDPARIDDQQTGVLAALLPRLTDEQQLAVLRHVEPGRARTVARLATGFRGAARAQAVDLAVGEAADVDPAVLGEAQLRRALLRGDPHLLSRLADRAPLNLLHLVAVAAERLPTGDVRAAVLLRLAARGTGPATVRAAIDAEAAVRGPASRFDEIASRLTADDRAYVLARLDTMPDPAAQADWLTWLVRTGDIGSRAAIAARAAGRILALPEHAERARRLAALAAADGSAGMSALAAEAIRALPEPGERATAWAQLAVSPDTRTRDDALRELAAISADIPGTAAEALRLRAGLAARMTAEQRTELLADLLNQPSNRARCENLAVLAPHLDRTGLARVAGLGDPALITALAPAGAEPDVLLETACSIPPGRDRADALTALVPHLAPAAVVALATHEREIAPTAAALSRITGRDDLTAALRGALADRTAEECHHLLAATAPAIRGVAGEQAVAASITAVLDVGRWWGR